MDLAKQTLWLNEKLAAYLKQFETESPPADLRDRDLFEKVKRETVPVYDMLEKWETAALKFLKEGKGHVHPQQIVSSRDNMELIMMHSYYHDVKLKRYMELNYSVRYVFSLLLDDLEQMEGR